MDRFHLVMDVIDHVSSLGSNTAYLKQNMCDKLIEDEVYIMQYGQEMTEIRNWMWFA